VLLVSHDRAFLDRTVTSILALDDVTHTLREHPGNYSDYALAMDRSLEKQWATYQEQQERMARLTSSIRKLSGKAQNIENETVHFHWRRIAKDLARRAVVQQRRLERMLESEELVDKPGLTWKMKLDFADMPRSGQDVLSIEGLTVGYGERLVLENVDLHLRFGERAALIGPNGAGKTTLLRCITGDLLPWAGQVRLGRGVRLGYMAQEQETLDKAATPLALLRTAAPLNETEARSFLHYFLFAGDEVFTPVGKLSFGERSRLALALLAGRGCNLLLLDEPINHLDIPSRESFERAMARFEGTVLAVVHDRYFIERFATTLWIVEDESVQVLAAG
jgi:ATP-binding cassette subfamily F protein 3